MPFGRLLLTGLRRITVVPLLVPLLVALAGVAGHGPRVGTLNATPSPVETLLGVHGCWSGPAPPGVRVPGHVVAARPGGPFRYYGAGTTGAALEQLFGHRNHHLRVAGFCR